MFKGRGKRSTVSIVFCVSLFLCFLGTAYAKKAIRIGILAKRGAEVAFHRWNPLARYLSKGLGTAFTIVPLPFSQLESYVSQGKVDMVFANQIFFVSLRKRFGVIPLATVKNIRGGPYMGGVIFVRRHSRIKGLTQLRGKKIGVVSLKSAGGFVIQASELMKYGLDVRKDCRIKVFNNQDFVVYAVLNGVMDAGFVRTGQLESMAMEKKIRLSQFTILNSRTYPDFKLRCSTSLWPAWPMAARKGMDPVLRKRIASKLVGLRPNVAVDKAARIQGFTEPGDYSPVETAMKALNML